MRAGLVLSATLAALGILGALANPNPGVQFLTYPLVKSGVTGSMHVADSTHSGYLSSADFVTFAAGGGGSATAYWFTSGGPEVIYAGVDSAEVFSATDPSSEIALVANPSSDLPSNPSAYLLGKYASGTSAASIGIVLDQRTGAREEVLYADHTTTILGMQKKSTGYLCQLAMLVSTVVELDVSGCSVIDLNSGTSNSTTKVRDLTVLGTCTGCGGGGGTTAYSAYASTSTYANPSAHVPRDNTLPVGCSGGAVEGTSILSVSYAAHTVGAPIRIDAQVSATTDGASWLICYISTDGHPAIANGVQETLGASNNYGADLAIMVPGHLAGDTSAHTYELCCGNTGGSAWSLNGTQEAGVGQLFTANGPNTSLMVQEYP